MKKIYVLVLKAFINPFIVTFFIVMFVLLMLFLFKYIDDLIGKGFEWDVIVKLMWYASATNVAMALPLAMLLSSIMTFGSLGENYELVAIKSAGISLQKAMRPLFITIGILSVAAFEFSNYMLPKANLKMGTLLWNVRAKKATFLIQEGVFNNSFPGYSLRVRKKDADGQTLHDVLIYNHNGSNGNMVTLMAKKGEMYITDNGRTLYLKLMDGVRYEESAGEGSYNPRQRLMRFRFKQTEQRFDLSVFNMDDVPEDAFKSSYMMLNQSQLRQFEDSTRRSLDSIRKSVYPAVQQYYSVLNPYDHRLAKANKSRIKVYPGTAMRGIPEDIRDVSIENARTEIRSINEALTTKQTVVADTELQIRRYIIEYQRKYTLAVSCLILFSIGAPLGAIIRKGGLGLPVVMSIIFFLLYHIISTIAEKSARDGSLDPVFGMWLAIVVLAPLGAFLTYKATVDSALFNIDVYKQFFGKWFKKRNSTA